MVHEARCFFIFYAIGIVKYLRSDGVVAVWELLVYIKAVQAKL